MEPGNFTIWDAVSSSGGELTWGEGLAMLLCFALSVSWMWWTSGEKE